MKLHRKQFTTLALAALATGFLGSATAQSAYPSKTVTMVVPTAAGGTTDLSARMLAQALGPVLGQTVVVDNKGGGNGNIAASIVKRAEADGYTLLMQYSGYHVISPHLMKQKQWELADFQPIANVLSAPQIIVVRDDVPARTLAELVAYAKANPGKLNYASSGNGSLQHVTGAMLEQQAGIKMTHVPYKGTGPALQDLLAGQVQLTFGTAPPFMQHIAAGKLRVLAVTGPQRVPTLPLLPTLGEVGFEEANLTSTFGFYAPSSTPPAIVQRMHAEVTRLLKTADMQERLRKLDNMAYPMDQPAFAALVRKDYVANARIISAAGIQAQ